MDLIYFSIPQRNITHFPTKIKLNITGIQHAKGSLWKAKDEVLKNVSKVNEFFEVDSRIYVFICMPENDDGVFGLVHPGKKLGYICDKDRNQRIHDCSV